MLFGKIKKSLFVLHKNDGRTDEEIKKEELEEKRQKSQDAGDFSSKKKKKKGCWRFRDELRKV